MLVEGVRQGRHHHLGDPSRPTTRRVGPDRPEYEPRGCPRGAAFSWYTYSPTRVRYPYVRGVLLEMYREAEGAACGDPVLAWADDRRRPGAAPPLQAGPRQGRAGAGELGRGGRDRRGRARAHDQDATAPTASPGSRPIPAMSMVVARGGRPLHALIGAPMLSFYDWYADLPVASPQVFGDQTDVPESGDWWDAAY